MIVQKEISLKPMRKGFHNIDDIVLNELGELPKTAILNVFVKHTSAALMINENADPDVRRDINSLLEKMAPESAPFYHHTLEGPDDMPAHFKTAVFGNSINIPVSNYRLNMGTWQSLFFCEFRNYGGSRKIVLSLYY
ncbi:MAG: secondary thiamine-phosphate synthase [Marinilabiliales bacterium]|nr:MAG: secondary thiamine-phosphate synthase [Marinilabiliales bacterium]